MTTQASGKVPQIRFKGFDRDWEGKKLDELGDTYSGLSGKTKEDFGHGYGRFVTYMNVFLNTVSDELMTEPIEVDATQYPVKYGDVFFTTSSETPQEVGMSSVWTAHAENVYLNSFCFGFRPTTKLNLFFLAYILRSTFFRKKISFLAQGISRYNISKRKAMELGLSLPSLAEQTQIGNYFRELDSLINLHQRKHDKLLTLKKAMLKKMFPQAGATTPEIRFGGFEGDWVAKSLGDLIDLGSGRDYKHLSPGDIPVYGTGGYMLSVNEALSTSANAIGIGRKGTIDKPYILKAPFWTVDTLFYAIPKSENYLDFVYCVFQQVNWKLRDESTGVPSLSKVAINRVSVLLTKPSEQQKIGSYFRTLDELISKHAIQLQKLKQIKSACLEKMFV